MLNKHASGALLCKEGRAMNPGVWERSRISTARGASFCWAVEVSRVPAGAIQMRRERRVDASTVGDADCYVAVSDCCDSIKTLLSLTCVGQHV